MTLWISIRWHCRFRFKCKIEKQKGSHEMVRGRISQDFINSLPPQIVPIYSYENENTSTEHIFIEYYLEFMITPDTDCPNIRQHWPKPCTNIHPQKLWIHANTINSIHQNNSTFLPLKNESFWFATFSLTMIWWWVFIAKIPALQWQKKNRWILFS